MNERLVLAPDTTTTIACSVDSLLARLFVETKIQPLLPDHIRLQPIVRGQFETVQDWVDEMHALLALSPVVTTFYSATMLPPWFPARGHSSDTIDIERATAAATAYVDHPRFMPYIQSAEMETFFLAQPEALAPYCAGQELVNEETTITEEDIISEISVLTTLSGEPELVAWNMGHDTTHAQRLDVICHGYVANVHGLLALNHLDMARLKRTCPRFNLWLLFLQDMFD
ncbi:MAG: DUF4276 family protein [Cyanobacteria bacterium HKST-UBA04]|nr:DUF4276 family protein [Cyanobacteria bacterium HKST-UBA04]MCA9842847.1 DUF4276 family protein [Cyanobacteria bacterium HKST-UBA03]